MRVRLTKTYFRLSPELVDGQTAEITDSPEAVLARVREWLAEFEDEAGGFSFTVETVEMTEEEFEGLTEL